MLKKLKRRFVLITMSLTGVILLVIFSGIYFFMAHSEERQAYDFMRNMARMDGPEFHRAPPMFDKNPLSTPKPKGTRFYQNGFLVKLSAENQITKIEPSFEDREQLEQVPTFIEQAEAKNTNQGIITVNNTQVRFLKEQSPSGKIMVFLDRSDELSTLNRLLMVCILIGLLSFIVLFMISLYLAEWAIAPTAKSWEKQKQFVADASHELKTPLTVIAANTDVVLSNPLDYVENQSKWLNYIKTETDRMTKLVNDLLYLAKVDDEQDLIHKMSFNISDAFFNISLTFESIIFESNKNFVTDISPDLMFYGDESKLKQVAIILLDNAIKNANENGDIHFSLHQDASHNKLIFSVTNTGSGIPLEQQDKIFERFYRVDQSRARETGGYGLGLSIAKSIVKQHLGTIHVESSLEGPTTFTVSLPLKQK